jgi:isoleucyl-tRNA synthetase
VLDVWFDSGSTHAFVLRDREDGTADGLADLYLEGTDQHRGWFHSSMLQACGTKGRAPYRGVLTHGFTLDEKGMKMSKSLGNTVGPARGDRRIRRRYPAALGGAVGLHRRPADREGNPERRRRQLSPPAQHAALPAGQPGGLLEAERVAPPTCRNWSAGCCTGWPNWMPRCARAMPYDFQGVFQKLFTFCTTDLSAVYFDIRKDALYCDAPTSLRRRACRTVLDILFHRLTTWLAPVLVFTMEEVWLERFPGEDARSICTTSPRRRPAGATRRWRRSGRRSARCAAW